MADGVEAGGCRRVQRRPGRVRSAQGDNPAFAHRLAIEADLPALTGCAIAELQRGFLSDAEIAVGFAVADRTYFIVEADGVLAGCCGSPRATLYGGDHTTAVHPSFAAAQAPSE